VLFSTGRDDFEAPLALVEGGPTAVIVKPFDSESLRRAIADIG